MSRFGTVPGLFEVPDSPTASFVGFGVLGDGDFFQDGYVLLEWWCAAAGFDFPGQIWYVSVLVVAHVVVGGDFCGR